MVKSVVKKEYNAQINNEEQITQMPFDYPSENESRNYNYESFRVDPIQQYYLEISKIPLLSPEEEYNLFLEYNNCEDEIKKLKLRNKIVEHNLKLVISIAKEYIGLGLDFLDLISEGNIGLINCVKKFDISLGNKFSSYATMCIKGAILTAINNKSKMIKIPSDLNSKFLKLNRLLSNYYQVNGNNIIFDNESIKSLTQELNISVENLILLLRYQYSISLYEKVKYNNVEYDDLINIIPDESINTEDYVIDKLRYKKIGELIDEIDLKPKQREILKRHYGYYGEDKSTNQVAKELKISMKNLERLELNALIKLRSAAKVRKI